jgi:hypothetical protein
MSTTVGSVAEATASITGSNSARAAGALDCFAVGAHLQKADSFSKFVHALAGIDFDERSSGNNFRQPARNQRLSDATLVLGHQQHLRHI